MIRGAWRLILTLLTICAAVLFASCGEEYVAPTFPDVVMPSVSITGVSDADTGTFLATDDASVVQSFNISVDAAQSIFPDCSYEDVSVSISNDTYFTFTYTQGESTFTVAPKQTNETSSAITATITAEVSEIYGGGVSQLLISQTKANIPSFTTQPQDVTFSSNISQGSTATCSFVIDPADVTDITKSNFSITESPYYYTTITEMSSTEYGYIVTFTATLDAVNAISSAGDDGLSISCMITLIYNESDFEMSNVFTISMPK